MKVGGVKLKVSELDPYRFASAFEKHLCAKDLLLQDTCLRFCFSAGEFQLSLHHLWMV
jgi:hypothetical protein